MEEGASPPRWALDKKLGEDASMEEKKEGEKEGGEVDSSFRLSRVRFFDGNFEVVYVYSTAE